MFLIRFSITYFLFFLIVLILQLISSIDVFFLSSYPFYKSKQDNTGNQDGSSPQNSDE